MSKESTSEKQNIEIELFKKNNPIRTKYYGIYFNFQDANTLSIPDINIDDKENGKLVRYSSISEAIEHMDTKRKDIFKEMVNNDEDPKFLFTIKGENKLYDLENLLDDIIRENNIEAMKFILESGLIERSFSNNIKDKNFAGSKFFNANPIEKIAKFCKNEKSEKMINLLLSNDLIANNLNEQINSGKNPLHTAIESNNIPAVNSLLYSKFAKKMLKQRNNKDMRAFHIAILGENSKIIELILKKEKQFKLSNQGKTKKIAALCDNLIKLENKINSNVTLDKESYKELKESFVAAFSTVADEKEIQIIKSFAGDIIKNLSKKNGIDLSFGIKTGKIFGKIKNIFGKSKKKKIEESTLKSGEGEEFLGFMKDIKDPFSIVQYFANKFKPEQDENNYSKIDLSSITKLPHVNRIAELNKKRSNSLSRSTRANSSLSS